ALAQARALGGFIGDLPLLVPLVAGVLAGFVLGVARRHIGALDDNGVSLLRIGVAGEFVVGTDANGVVIDPLHERLGDGHVLAGRRAGGHSDDADLALLGAGIEIVAAGGGPELVLPGGAELVGVDPLVHFAAHLRLVAFHLEAGAAAFLDVVAFDQERE